MLPDPAPQPATISTNREAATARHATIANATLIQRNDPRSPKVIPDGGGHRLEAVNSLLQRRVRAEQAGQGLAFEWIDYVQMGERRRAGLGGHHLGRPLQLA